MNPEKMRGNQNARIGRLKKSQITPHLEEALRTFEHENKGDKDPVPNVKKGEAGKVIASEIVKNAVLGDKWYIQFLTDRIEGKAIARVDTKAKVSGKIEHIPVKLVGRQGQVIDLAPESKKIGSS